jgi:asparagine N-glycosylation enzyme membrane subunit Stt3
MVRFPKKNSTSKYRSSLEDYVIADLKFRNINFKYEATILQYVKTMTKHRYTPDITLDNGILVEIKGYFTSSDRKKHLLVKEQYPDLDIRFVFGNSKNKLNKNSKTTYADWCEKNNIKYADKTIPRDWVITN